MGANKKRLSPIQGPERYRDSPPLTKRELDEIIDNPFSTSYTYASADPNGSYTIPRLGRRFPEPDTSWFTTITSLPSSKIPWVFCCGAVLFAALLLVNNIHNQSCPQQLEEKNVIIGIADETGSNHLLLGSAATESADAQLQQVLGVADVQKTMIPTLLPPCDDYSTMRAIAFEVNDELAVLDVDLPTNAMEDVYEQTYSNRSHMNMKVNTTTTNSSTAVDFPLPSSVSPFETESNFESSNSTDNQSGGFAFGFGQANLRPWGFTVEFKYNVPPYFQLNFAKAIPLNTLWLDSSATNHSDY